MPLPLWRQQLEKIRKNDPDRYTDLMERAAILEFDGGLSREAAEKKAWEMEEAGEKK